MQAVPRVGVRVLCEPGQPWAHKAELRPASSVRAFAPYRSRGAVVRSPGRPWLQPEHPPGASGSLRWQRTSGKCASTARRRRSPSCGSGWRSWRSGWSLSWAPGPGWSKRQGLPTPRARRGQGLPGVTPRSGAAAGAGRPRFALGASKASRGCGSEVRPLAADALTEQGEPSAFCWFEKKDPKASSKLKKLRLHQAKFNFGQA